MHWFVDVGQHSFVRFPYPPHVFSHRTLRPILACVADRFNTGARNLALNSGSQAGQLSIDGPVSGSDRLVCEKRFAQPIEVLEDYVVLTLDMRAH